MNFFDASALVKRYVREAGTPAVNRLLAAGGAAICRLTEAEVSSALARRRREGSLTVEQADDALSALRRDLGQLHVVELAPALVGRVHVLLARHPLRASDALQLASAAVLREAVGAEVVFVAYDERLRAAAKAEGFSLRPRSAQAPSSGRRRP